MRLRTIIELLAALFLTVAALAALSQMARAGGMRVENAHARPSLGAVTSGVVYMTLVNETGQPDRLRSAATDVAASAELHLHKARGDIMTMAKLECLTIPPHGRIDLAPGGLHLMLIGLEAPLKEGRRFALRLTFDHAGELHLDVEVKSQIAAPRPSSALQFCE